jgi:hypothetical protein
MKPNHPNNHTMSASSVEYQKLPAGCIRVLSPFLRQLNTRSLALILFLAFALLSTTRGKEAETRESASAGSTKSKVVINNQHDDVRCAATKTAGQMLPPLGQGYLKVYSVSDEFNDGAYYAHGSYEIYSTDGRLFKRVENSISRTDELIPWEVALPIGSYTVVAQSARGGEVRVHFVIKAGRRTIVDLDLAEQETYRRRLADQ